MFYWLDTIEETYNKDPLLTLYQKTPPIRILSLLKKMFFDRGQEEDPYCKLAPLLHLDKKHGKVGKDMFSCLGWAMSFVFFLGFFLPT